MVQFKSISVQKRGPIFSNSQELAGGFVPPVKKCAPLTSNPGSAPVMVCHKIKLYLLLIRMFEIVLGRGKWTCLKQNGKEQVKNIHNLTPHT
jgi:hypothetical protein